MYAKVENSAVTETKRRPTWIDAATGNELTDSELIARGGLYPVTDNAPAFDSETQNIVANPQSDWVIHETFVEKTYTVTNKTVSEQKPLLRGKAQTEYQASLERGFSFDGGQFPATGSKRARVVELVAGINAGKGLPQGKTSLTFRDLSGTGHNLDAQGITNLGATGSDLVDQADDRYEELMGQIDAASTQADLDAIDLTSGWPN